MTDNLVESYPIEPTYRKDNGLMLQDIDRQDLPFGFDAVSRSLVVIPPGEVGGNHVHARQEAFIGIGEGLEIFWLDESGERHSEHMNPAGQLKLFVIRSMVPHAVRNNSGTSAVLLEYADLSQEESSIEEKTVI